MDHKHPEDQKYLREVQGLTTVWHDLLNRQERQHRQEALCNVFHFIQDGVYGIEGRWKAEAEQRQAAIPRVAFQEDRPFKKLFFEFAGAVYDYQVALAMADVARLMIYKTEEGFDKRWLGLVERVSGEGVCDDNSNHNVALGFLLNEEVKLRRGEAFSPFYFWLRSNNEQEQAQLHLNAFVRSQIALSPGHDLLEAVKCSEASTEPSVALLLELRSELVAPLLDLSPKALKKLPSQASYGIRKRLLPIASNTSDAVESPSAQLATDFFNSERLSEAKQEAKQALERLLNDAGLTPDQYEVYRLNKVEGMTLADIAQRLDKAPGTVASHKARAREKIEEFKKKSS